MKTKNMLVIGMVALAAIMFSQRPVYGGAAQALVLAISPTGVISWSKEIGAVYRVFSSTNLLAWQEVTTVTNANTFALAMTNGARYFRVQKFPPLLTVANGNMPGTDILLAGINDYFVAQYRFSAGQEGYTVERLKFIAANRFASSTVQVTVKYTDRLGAAKQAQGVFVIPDLTTDGVATFTGLAIYVPANGDSSINIYVDVASLSSGGVSGGASAITLLANDGFSATGDSGTVVTSAGPTYLTGNAFFVRKSKPIFVKLDAGTNPVNGPLYRFSAVADAAGNVDLKKLSFRVSAVGCQVSGLYLYDPSSSVVLTGIVNPIGEIAGLPIGAVDDEKVLVISATPKIYELRGTVTGYGQVGDSIAVEFVRDMFAPQDGTAHDVAVGSYNAWSDRSSFSHSVSSRDWTNGSLLKDMSGIQIFSR